jgi:hypothetical protein
MSRKRLVDVIHNVLRSELDTWGSDHVHHHTACDIRNMLMEVSRSKRVSTQDRHLARYCMRYVKYPSVDEFNTYLDSLHAEHITKTWLNGVTRASAIVPWLCKLYATNGPCTKRRVRARRFL